MPSAGAALSVARQVSSAAQPAAGQRVANTATSAFLHGLTGGCLVAGSLTAAGAIAAAFFLPAQPASPAPRPAGAMPPAVRTPGPPTEGTASSPAADAYGHAGPEP